MRVATVVVMTTPEPAPDRVTTRLTTPAQMVASLPLWLGYVPTRSLVVACQHEPRGRVGLTMRFDLPDVFDEDLLVEEVLARVEREGATRALVAVYSDEPDDERIGVRARELMVHDLCDGLRTSLGARVTEAVLVRDGRFWSYLCDDTRCCPAEGTPVDAAVGEEPVSLLEAEQVLRGQVVAKDRDALVRGLAGPGPVLAECHAIACRCAGERLPGTVDRPAWRERTLRLWGELAQQVREGGRDLDPDELADLVVSLRDVVLRDAVLAEHTAEELGPLLRVLVRFAPHPYDAGVCTALAWLLYCDGGGAEVTVLLERALATNPRYGLARLLTDLLRAQVPPTAIRGVTRSLQGLPGARRTRRR